MVKFVFFDTILLYIRIDNRLYKEFNPHSRGGWLKL